MLLSVLEILSASGVGIAKSFHQCFVCKWILLSNMFLVKVFIERCINLCRFDQPVARNRVFSNDDGNLVQI